MHTSPVLIVLDGAGAGDDAVARAAVAAAALAVIRGVRERTVLVDLHGGAGELLHRIGRGGLSVHDWLNAPAPPPDALRRIEVRAGPNVSILRAGKAPSDAAQEAPGVALLLALYANDERAVVVNAGPAASREWVGPLAVAARTGRVQAIRAEALVADPVAVRADLGRVRPGRRLPRRLRRIARSHRLARVDWAAR